MDGVGHGEPDHAMGNHVAHQPILALRLTSWAEQVVEVFCHRCPHRLVLNVQVRVGVHLWLGAGGGWMVLVSGRLYRMEPPRKQCEAPAAMG